MQKNVGLADRVVRIIAAVGLCVLIYMGVLGGQTAQIVVGVVAAYLLITGLLARCLVYQMAGIDTCVQEQPYSDTDDRSGV
jgi:hypothetical protein